MQINRRQFVQGVLGSGAVSTFLIGCGGGQSASTGATNHNQRSNESSDMMSSTSYATETSLTFSETKEFYEQLSRAVESGENVVVGFDGEHHVGENSKFLTEFMAKATNWEELWKEFQDKDTESGRKDLEHVFTVELLKHKALKDDSRLPNGDVKLPSGEVIGPATVVLVLGIILILAATSVAHAESARGRKYRIAIQEPATGIELYFQGEP